MTIIREKSHSKNFVTLYKEVLNDDDLSLKAKGLWAYLMGLPDNWKINSLEVAQHCRDGRDSVRAALNELEENGYAAKIKRTNDKGQFDKGGWVVFEVKKMKESKEKPGPENPAQVEPTQGKPSLVNTNIVSTERAIEEREGASAPKPPISASNPIKIERTLHIKTSKHEHEKLLNSFGEDRVKSLYELLSEWKTDTPTSKWKKSDYRSILRWVNDALNDRELKVKKRNDLASQESNVDHAHRIAEEFNAIRGPQLQVQLTTTQESLVIYTTHPTSTRKPFTIKFKENAFQEQVHSALRKWGLL